MSLGRSLVLALTLASVSVASQAVSSAPSGRPEVLKVEPPSWWPGHSIDPVRLLVRGRNLGGARVDSAGEGLAAGPLRVNAEGTYLFLDVHVEAKASPGIRRIKVRTAAGAVEIPFELLTPLPREGRFQGFSPDDVIYLIMPDRFANGDVSNDDPAASRGLMDRKRVRYYHGGDLKGIIDHLPYLKDLGVTALWLNPWYDNVNHLNDKETYDDGPITDYHGYGAVDFYGVEEHLGTLATLRDLVDSAHALGIKIIQDQVANHTGPYHPWVADPPTPTWFNGTAKAHLANKWQTWTIPDPHASLESRRETLDGWFIDILPDLNQSDEEASRYLIQNTLWWVGVTGLDGIRQDTWQYVPRPFWRTWTAAIKREYEHLKVVGEVVDADPALVSFHQGGVTGFDGVDSGLDSLFDFPLFYPLRRAFAEGKALREVALMLGRDRLYPRPDELVTLLGLHDVPRFMSEPGASIAGLELAFTFLATARGIPMVYYGDEIAMSGGSDPDNRRDFPGGWRDDSRNAFVPSGRTADEQSTFDRLRLLLHLRAELPALRRGAMVNLAVDEQAWAYARRTEGQSVVVLLNNGKEQALLDCNADQAGLAEGQIVVDRLGALEPIRVASGRLKATLPPRSAAVLAAQ
ncbi:MAG: alpha-amylase family glycosyl hydrolase [Vicinamibacteria bacterium]